MKYHRDLKRLARRAPHQLYAHPGVAAFVYVLLLEKGEPLTPESALVAQQVVLDALDAPRGRQLKASLKKRPRKPLPAWTAEQVAQLREIFGDRTVDTELGIHAVQCLLQAQRGVVSRGR
jgi:hypothetical protein